jgi:hypothetical protein
LVFLFGERRRKPWEDKVRDKKNDAIEFTGNSNDKTEQNIGVLQTGVPLLKIRLESRINITNNRTQ